MTDTLKQQNQLRWSKCKINSDRDGLFTTVAARLTAPAAKTRYKAVEAKTGVPWWFIAVTHEREASQSWTKSLAQGDPWNKVSTHVPAGRGPFKSWEDAAYDALVNCPPYAARNKDWSAGGSLAMLEKYNGLGYSARGVPSPYIWSGTDQYVKGKFIADHVYDPNTVDKQLGCAGLLKKMNVDFSTQVGAVTAAGAVVVAGATAASQSEPHLIPWIIAGTVVAAILGYVLYNRYVKGKTDAPNT